MLIHLKLDNFKIWKTTGPMQLAPVTLLLGTNSSGKSSLIQSLLLIRQTVNSGDPDVVLHFGGPGAGDSVTLGQFKDVLCQHGSSPMVGVEFRWSPTGKAADSALFSARYLRGAGGAAVLEFLRLGKDEQGFIVQRQKPGIYRLLVANESKSRGQSADFRPQRSFALSPKALARLRDVGARIQDVGPELLEELGRIIYLGPIRRLAKREYVWNGRMPATIGDDGGNAVEALIASGVAAQAARRARKPPPPEASLISETAKWLKNMDLAEGLSLKRVGGSTSYELMVERQGEATNLKDVGVGVSQVLPVIVSALYAAAGHIVIIEEPESHLHPLAEAQLAELFAEISRRRRVQFIVETHSEHLFRRMQTLIATERFSPDEIAMYFVERDGPDAKLRKLVPNEFGAITNWPERFFGDAIGEAREQAKARAERELAKAKAGNADR